MAAATTETSVFKETPIRGRGINWRYHRVSSTSDLDELNDILKFHKLPEGATILEVILALGDLDSNGTPLCTHSVQCTDGTTTKVFITNTTVGRAGGIARMDTEASAGYTTTNNSFHMEVKTTAPPATAQAADCFLAFAYVVDQPN